MNGFDPMLPLLVPPASAQGLRFSQAVLLTWNPDTFENTVEWRGITLTNVPVFPSVDALAFQPGAVLGLLGWNPGGGTGSWWILGQIGIPPLAEPVRIRGGDLVVEDGDIVITGNGDFEVREEDGSVTVLINTTSAGGGQIATFHPNGVPHMVAGQLFFEESGDVQGQGFLLQRDDRVDVFSVVPFNFGDPPVIRTRDTGGHLAWITRTTGGWSMFAENSVLAVSTDETHGEFLNRPFLDVPMYSTSSLGNWSTDDTSFATIALGRLWVTHPYVRVQIRAWTSGATAGQARVLVAGTQVGSTLNIPNNVNATIFDFDNLVLPAAQLSAPYSFQAIEIQARSLTAGQLTVCIPYGVTKRGTP